MGTILAVSLVCELVVVVAYVWWTATSGKRLLRRRDRQAREAMQQVSTGHRAAGSEPRT